ncbi:NAD(P)H-binding protein [Novosphingobium flavum]|uniref:NAD(P)H-binding protein n=1 Tax=Novosphingobium flavum TaxID=1778672 RepID=A0A7X1FQE5_9SPHN|nr:NAD-dependent epimerase/dehydratase family protein [Novosphingobium flavum]MBC2665003.1 NAD(P)H-binding protein [Novosphingobium flavum]
MSKAVRICLVGASGLVGSALIRAAVGRRDVRLVAIARRELDLPPGARMEVLVADPANWGDAIAAARPDTVVNCLGTTWKQAGEDEAVFRAVDQDLVLACAKWGQEAGARQFISVSSVGAAISAKQFYLRVKGEVETTLGKLGYNRLDILRPGLLRGSRRELRPAERIGQVVAPLADLFLRGGLARYRSVRADWLAEVILALAHEKARGRFVHEHEAMERALKRQAYHASIAQAQAVD